MIDNELWLPILLESAVATAATGRLGAETGGTLDLKATFKVGDRTLTIEDSYAAPPPARVGLFVARDLGTIVAIISRNGLVRAAVDEITVEAVESPEIELSWIEQLVPERSTVSPGETIEVLARLRPYRGEAKTIRFEVPIPADAAGDIELHAGGAIEIDRRDAAVYGERVPRDLDDLLGLLAERRPGRGLYARTYLKRPGLRVNVDLMSSLPPSQRAALGEQTGVAVKPVSEAFGPAVRVPHPGVVAGSLSVGLRVVR